MDRRPLLCYPDAFEGADALVVTPDQVSRHAGGDKVVLAEVTNAFQLGFYNALKAAPKEAAGLLDAATDSVKSFIALALGEGADGIFYRLNGATAAESTPMLYGGHFLERDREILEAIQDANLNVLFVSGEGDVYLDFVSDLPAHLFAWDSAATGLDSAYVRSIRDGAQASSDPDSEVEFRLTTHA